MTRRSFIPVGALAALVAFSTCGCRSTPKKPSVWPPEHPTFGQNARTYRHVELAPIFVTGQGTLDKSLSYADLIRLQSGIGQQLGNCFRETLKVRGYQTDKTPLVVAGFEDWEGMDEDQGEIVNEALGEFNRIVWSLTRNRGKERYKPLHYKMGMQIDDLKKTLGMGNAAAILFVRTGLVLESEEFRNFRHSMNAAVWLTGKYIPNPGQISFHVALVDAQTHELLWYNRRDRGQDPRSETALQNSVDDVLSTLPRIQAESEGKQ